MKNIYKVTGMDCGHCVAAITKAITSRGNNVSVQVDLDAGKVTVFGKMPEDKVAKAVEYAGFIFDGQVAAN